MIKVKKSLVGQRFGHLVVVEQTDDHQRANSRAEPQWVCLCDCGNYVVKYHSSLVKARCPANLMCDVCAERNFTLIGKRFGHLTVISRADDYVGPQGKHRTRWLCKCDCGNTMIKFDSELRHASKDHMFMCADCRASEFDLTGQRFGSLTVLERAENYIIPSTGEPQTQWLCQCDCGRRIVVGRSNLVTGGTQSCGCSKRKSTEQKIYGVGTFDGEAGELVYNKSLYDIWRGILKRCYDPKSLEKTKTYHGCHVCEDWFLYSNFKKWYLANQWYTGEMKVHVDKDILVKGNRKYGPDVCCVVPATINSLFASTHKRTGDLPVGVYYETHRATDDKYVAHLCCDGRKKRLGYFTSAEDAFLCYKQAKERRIREVADQFKHDYPNMPQKLYDAMYNYEVEITD